MGNELKDLSRSFPEFDFVFFSREEFPINDETIAIKIFEEQQPSFLINCAAYTAVDKAETEIESANDINGTAVGILASLCQLYRTGFVHISTDYVFNALKQEPLKETDPVDPVNAYGASKLLGEQLAIQNNPESIIIRTSWVYSYYGKNFVKTMMRLMKEKESISVVGDQYGSPTYAADLAAAIMHIITSGSWIPGIYHYSNEGHITWFDFATEIRNLIDSDCQVHSINTSQYPTPARRPVYSVMNTNKIRNTYHLDMKNWRDSLEVCIRKLVAVDG